MGGGGRLESTLWIVMDRLRLVCGEIPCNEWAVTAKTNHNMDLS